MLRTPTRTTDRENAIERWRTSLRLSPIKSRDRANELTKFTKLHMDSFLSAITLLDIAQSPRRLDVSRDAVIFRLAHRTDHDGNPAKLFTLEDIQVVPLVEMLLTCDKKRLLGLRQLTDTQYKAGCTGLLYVRFEAGEVVRNMQLGFAEEFDLNPVMEACVEQLGGSWMKVTQANILAGTVLLKGQGCGVMIKDGKDWRWRRVDEPENIPPSQSL